MSRMPMIKGWSAPVVIAVIGAHVERGTRRACEHVVGEMKKAVNRSQPVIGSGKNMRGLDPSKPGEPPKKVTSQLQSSLTYKVDYQMGGFVRGLVGSPLGTAPWLEFGTEKMAPRPFARPAVRGNAKQIRSLIVKG